MVTSCAPLAGSSPGADAADQQVSHLLADPSTKSVCDGGLARPGNRTTSRPADPRALLVSRRPTCALLMIQRGCLRAAVDGGRAVAVGMARIGVVPSCGPAALDPGGCACSRTEVADGSFCPSEAPVDDCAGAEVLGDCGSARLHACLFPRCRLGSRAARAARSPARSRGRRCRCLGAGTAGSCIVMRHCSTADLVTPVLRGGPAGGFAAAACYAARVACTHCHQGSNHHEKVSDGPVITVSEQRGPIWA
jgi:hypothetical protein